MGARANSVRLFPFPRFIIVNIKKVEAIVRISKLDAVLERLRDIVDGATVSEVRGVSRADRFGRGVHRGVPYRSDPLNVKVEVIAVQSDVDDVVNAIIYGSRTGVAGDGCIFVSDVSDVMRIRNAQCGEAAL